MKRYISIGTESRAVYNYRLSKAFILKFPEDYPGRQAPEEGRWVQRTKRLQHSNKDNDNSVCVSIMKLVITPRHGDEGFAQLK